MNVIDARCNHEMHIKLICDRLETMINTGVGGGII